MGHHVCGGTGGHRAGDAGKAIGIARRQAGVGGQHRQAVAGVHKAAAAHDHVAIAVAVAGGPKTVVIAIEQQAGQLMGIGEVGVGVAAAKILQWDAIANGAGRRPQQPFQQAAGIGASDGVHRVKGDREIAAQQGSDLIEIEQALHQCHVVLHPVDHLHHQFPQLLLAADAEVGRRRIRLDAISIQAGGFGIDGVGDRFRRRTAVGAVHLDAEVAVWTTRIVASRENDAGDGAVAADQVRGGGGGEDAAGGGDYPCQPMGRGHAADDANGLAVAIAAVSPHHQGAAGDAGDGAQRGLDKAFEVVGGGKLAGALAQPRGARLLVAEGLGKADVLNAHGWLPACRARLSVPPCGDPHCWASATFWLRQLPGGGHLPGCGHCWAAATARLRPLPGCGPGVAPAI